MRDERPKVLIIGGSGVFGAHVCRRLARLKICQILIGGRSAQNSKAVIDELLQIDAQCQARFVHIDRTKLTDREVAKLGVLAIVDAAGPFQGSSYGLVEAAIGAGVHYIDLCDARDFVKGISAFDSSAKAANIAVLTGASSTPALSNAMLRDLVEDWRSIDRIQVSIVPGNKAPRGRSVMQAILSWAGNPVLLFDQGRWQVQSGWSGQRSVSLGMLGERYTALAETPDLDVLVDEFYPRVSARFHAGLELGLMHNGLRALAWLRRNRLLPNLAVLTTPLLWASNLMGNFGTDTGGMVVEAIGIDRKGEAVQATARLIATDGHGPIIPALGAVALLKRIVEGRLVFRGASHVGRCIAMTEILALVDDLEIHLEVDEQILGASLFQTVLGADFELMPATTRLLHRGAPAVFGDGEADITEPDNMFGQWISALFGFPKPGKRVPVSVLVERDGMSEHWIRRYPGREMISLMGSANANQQTLEEKFGPLSFRMKITGHATGLDMYMQSVRIGWLRLPNFLVPKVSASERTDEQGRHVFDVSISMPMVGRIVRYQGWLSLCK